MLTLWDVIWNVPIHYFATVPTSSVLICVYACRYVFIVYTIYVNTAL